MSNTQNTIYYQGQLLGLNNGNEVVSLLITDMTSYATGLESTINGDAESYDFSSVQSPSFKQRIGQLEGTISGEQMSKFMEFLTYIIVYEKVLYCSVQSFQVSASLNNTEADDIVTQLREKRKSKIPPAKSLPHRPKPVWNLDEIELSISQLNEELSPEFFSLLMSFLSILRVMDNLDRFLVTNDSIIKNVNSAELSDLARNMAIYSMSLFPQVQDLQTAQPFDDVLSTQFATTLSSLENSIDSELYSAFQSFLNYIETLENPEN